MKKYDDMDRHRRMEKKDYERRKNGGRGKKKGQKQTGRWVRILVGKQVARQEGRYMSRIKEGKGRKIYRQLGKDRRQVGGRVRQAEMKGETLVRTVKRKRRGKKLCW